MNNNLYYKIVSETIFVGTIWDLESISIFLVIIVEIKGILPLGIDSLP